MDKYFVGTKFELVTTFDGIHEKQSYMLCETHSDKKLFQIICISGHNSGKLTGYIDIQTEMLESGFRAIDRDFFMNEIKKNFLFEEGSFKIIE